MHLIIGTGGNQKLKITQPDVAPCHCVIIPDDNDIFVVEPTNYRPTYIDGERIVKDTVVTPQTAIQLGDSFFCKIGDLVPHFDISSLVDWGLAAERFNSIIDLDVFQITVDLCYPDEDLNVLNLSSLKLCRAYRLIQEKKFRAAQILIYEAGDELFASQDGSQELKNAYLAAMILLYYFYKEAGLKDMADLTRQRCDSMLASELTCSPFVSNLLSN